MSEYPEVINTIERKARKDHICCECGKVIKKHQKYKYTSGIWDGYPMSFKQCSSCECIMGLVCQASGVNDYDMPSYCDLREWFYEFVCSDFNGADWLIGMAELIKISPEKLNKLLKVDI